MTDCGNCGHGDHRDTGTANFCFRMTGNGLCGCENYVEADPPECPTCGVVDCYSCEHDFEHLSGIQGEAMKSPGRAGSGGSPPGGV